LALRALAAIHLTLVLCFLRTSGKSVVYLAEDIVIEIVLLKNLLQTYTIENIDSYSSSRYKMDNLLFFCSMALIVDCLTLLIGPDLLNVPVFLGS